MIEDLAGSELFARLTQRGMDADTARQIVARRDYPNEAKMIREALKP
jgi:hypothetical protein